MFSNSWVMTWVGGLEWIELTAAIEEGEVVLFSHNQRRAWSRETRKVNVIKAI